MATLIRQRDAVYKVLREDKYGFSKVGKCFDKISKLRLIIQKCLNHNSSEAWFVFH